MKKEYFIAAVFTIVIFAVVICNLGNVSGATASEDISEMEEKLNENESIYAEIQEKLKILNNSKEDMASYIANLNDSYNTILSVINDLDEQIASKNLEIESINTLLSEKEIEIEEYYDNMAMRIQFIYENNSMDIISMIINAGSISDVISMVSYYNDIIEYDRKALDKIEAEIEQNNQIKEKAEDEIAELEKLKSEQDNRRTEMESMMAEASVNIGAKQSQIDEAESIARAMVAEMEEQRNSVEKLKEEESRRVAEELRKQQMAEQGITETTYAYQYLDGDVRKLAAIIYCEARGEPYAGQLAVASVVMNRVESSKFPNTIEEVIAQPYQFTPYEMGLYAIALAIDNMQQSCIDAAIEVIQNGYRSGDWLYFRTFNNIVQGTIIGNHVFY